jgi:hypothetical protein
MCNSVNYRGQCYESPAELAELLGGVEKLVWQDTNPFVGRQAQEDWHVMDQCLCPIDLEATLRNAGFTWTRGVDPMEWHITVSA